MNRRRALYAFLAVLALFLLGTVVVLSSVTYYLAIDPAAYLTEKEVPILDNSTRWSAAAHGKVERIQRIIHQTWKSETLPPAWRGLSQACKDKMPDYEYKLWTDAGSREFIAEHYSWFLDTFDNYVYPIQRADAIRYFVLYHYGGVYIDLDIGCLKPLDPLLVNSVILPKTIPVGVSNDLMFAEKGHPFLKQTIYNLMSFDHSWVINYPTVMFSTGPMFLSIQYGLYTASNPDTVATDIRILPKSLYGKNAKPGQAPHTFFEHKYGSSWHADDAGFIWFLGTWGKVLMWVGLAILIIGLIRLPSSKRRSFRRIGGYEIVLPRLSRSGRWHFHLGRGSSGYSTSSGTSTSLPSPVSSDPDDSPIDGVPVLHLPFDVSHDRTPSRDDFPDAFAGRTHSPLVEAFRRVRNRVGLGGSSAGYSPLSAGLPREPDTPTRGNRSSESRGVLFFLPAVFTAQTPDIELQPAPPPRSTRALAASAVPRRAHASSMYPPEKERYGEDVEAGLRAPSPNRTRSAGSGSRTAAGDEDYTPLVDVDGSHALHSRTSTASSSSTTVADPSEPWRS